MIQLDRAFGRRTDSIKKKTTPASSAAERKSVKSSHGKLILFHVTLIFRERDPQYQLSTRKFK